MNIRKNIDYSEMYVALDTAIAAGKEQVKQYTLIGQAVCASESKRAKLLLLRRICVGTTRMFKGSLSETCAGCGISIAPMNNVPLCRP